MKINKAVAAIILVLFLTYSRNKIHSCSMYKITATDKTMVGFNQDAWKVTASIWFENAIGENEYGVCMTGSREIGPNKFAPASGMNDVGLSFATLAAYHPHEEQQQIGKKKISNRADYLTDIMHKCRTVEEVRNYIELYDHSIFKEQVFLYIDRSGEYLIVEPYALTKGNDPTYVLANFCPSITSNQDARRMKRYRDGEDYLSSNTPLSSLEFCRSLSDTMSVCRSRNGDGTLLTAIWDTQKGVVNLYFYHDYSSTVQFNISEELEWGNHAISIPEIFPVNSHFQRLTTYRTPVTAPSLIVYFAFIVCFIVGLSFIYFVSFLRKRSSHNFNIVKLLFAGLNVVLFVYLFVLARDINIYYFDAPYRHYSSDLISLSSYIPFLLLLAIIPITVYNFRYLKSNAKSIFIKSSLVVNNTIYLILLFAFGYWGLFDVLN